MPLPITLALAYLGVNVVLMVWLERERAQDRAAGRRMSVIAPLLRYGPPVLGLIYLVTLAGDWMFFVFVIIFFAASFWLMDGLLAFTVPARGPDAMRNGWDDRNVRAQSSSDRENT
jgi:hypothetical protein